MAPVGLHVPAIAAPQLAKRRQQAARLQATAGSDAVLDYLDELAAVALRALNETAAPLSPAGRLRFVTLAYRRGLSPLGRAPALSAPEAAELHRLEARLNGGVARYGGGPAHGR